MGGNLGDIVSSPVNTSFRYTYPAFHEPEIPKDGEDMTADSKYLDRKRQWETLLDEIKV